jgi:hypothetical protein
MIESFLTAIKLTKHLLQDIDPNPHSMTIDYYVPGPKTCLSSDAPSLANLMKTHASLSILPTEGKRKARSETSETIKTFKRSDRKKAKTSSKVTSDNSDTAE